MQINLDEVIRSQPDWDLQLQVGGKLYATRAVTDADVATLRKLGESANADGAHAFLRGLFVGDDVPPVETWDSTTTTLVVMEVMAYRQWRNDELVRSAKEKVLAQLNASAGANASANGRIR